MWWHLRALEGCDPVAGKRVASRDHTPRLKSRCKPDQLHHSKSVLTSLNFSPSSLLPAFLAPSMVLASPLPPQLVITEYLLPFLGVAWQNSARLFWGWLEKLYNHLPLCKAPSDGAWALLSGSLVFPWASCSVFCRSDYSRLPMSFSNT